MITISGSAAVEKVRLSIVIPTLNVAEHIGTCLDAVGSESDSAEASDFDVEIIVCDGGSKDSTLEIAQSKRARIVLASKGRANQFIVGAAETTGDWLMFLHADTVLTSDWREKLNDFIVAHRNSEVAGYFGFRLDDKRLRARFVERLVALRCKWLGLPYGDQVMVLPSAFYNRLGGYKNLPLMEDVDLVRRVRKVTGRKGLRRIKAEAVTSARRYRRDGYLKRSLTNIALISGYSLGVRVDLLARVYYGRNRDLHRTK